jgi:hypothetical protein
MLSSITVIFLFDLSVKKKKKKNQNYDHAGRPVIKFYLKIAPPYSKNNGEDKFYCI